MLSWLSCPQFGLGAFACNKLIPGLSFHGACRDPVLDVTCLSLDINPESPAGYYATRTLGGLVHSHTGFTPRAVVKRQAGCHGVSLHLDLGLQRAARQPAHCRNSPCQPNLVNSKPPFFCRFHTHSKTAL